MGFPEVTCSRSEALELEDFRQMDYYAMNIYNLPIELMIENAGLQLANLITSHASKDQVIKISAGNGHNGGGGLVAARRLAGWGYSVYLELFAELTNPLVVELFERALKFGAKHESIQNPGIWIDAYLGFSQHLPLNNPLLGLIEQANASKALKISLDIPTGFLGDTDLPFFRADKVLTLAAPKKILYNLNRNVEIFIADIGIPEEVYLKFETQPLPFHKNGIVKLKR
jgi:NAD(P)H-hydrate epimerase